MKKVLVMIGIVLCLFSITSCKREIQEVNVYRFYDSTPRKIIDKEEIVELEKMILNQKYKKDDEKIYEYELNATAKCCIGGGGEIQVFVSDTYIGDIKKGSRAKVKKLLESGTIQRIDAEVSGGNYKILKNVNDSYIVDELEDAFSITIEITYREEIKEEQ